MTSQLALEDEVSAVYVFTYQLVFRTMTLTVGHRLPERLIILQCSFAALGGPSSVLRARDMTGN